MCVCLCAEQREARVMSVEGVEGRRAGRATKMTSPEASVVTQFCSEQCKQVVQGVSKEMCSSCLMRQPSGVCAENR